MALISNHLNDRLQTGDRVGGHRLRVRQQFRSAVQNLLPTGLFQPADEFRQSRDADAAATGFEFVRDAVQTVGVSLLDRRSQQVELKRRIVDKVTDQNDKILLQDIPQFGDDFISDQRQLVEIGVAHADYSLVTPVWAGNHTDIESKIPVRQRKPPFLPGGGLGSRP